MPRPVLTVIAALLAIVLAGGHTTGMQVVAWASMLVARSAQEGFSLAVESTFSGEKPCRMCMAVKAIKAQEDGLLDKPCVLGKGDPGTLQ